MKDGSFYQVTLAIQKIVPTVVDPQTDDHYVADWGYYQKNSVTGISSEILKECGNLLVVGLSQKLLEQQGIS